MISLQLRTTASHNRREMLRLIIDQLRGIGGTRAVGFGPGRVTSLPDAVAGVLEEFYFTKDMVKQLALPLSQNGKNGNHATPEPHSNGKAHIAIPSADMCPSCGTISLVRAEGCRKCLTCDYAEC